jgi:hypothetical protein
LTHAFHKTLTGAFLLEPVLTDARKTGSHVFLPSMLEPLHASAEHSFTLFPDHLT